MRQQRSLRESRGQQDTTGLDIRTSIAATKIMNSIERPKGYTVSYHANPEVEGHHFGACHPMKPWRLTLTNKLVISYGMHDAMDLYVSRAATEQELISFHTERYVKELQRVNPSNTTHDMISGIVNEHNFGDDCPVFDGLFRYCSLYSGASLDAARKITSHQSDIAINWSGGLHHAKKNEASGFCYVNDIVLAIQQLLLHHPRVLYIDIDVHHGDGVEQAFWSTDRVLTVSFHKYDGKDFFPGTGALDDTGPKNHANPGSHHSINVPLHSGIEDDQYKDLFKKIVGPCIEQYKPTAIVLQCGADSLGGDRLGVFNLNIEAHGFCVDFVKAYKIPLILLGGGGYTPRNVARLWAYETSLAIGVQDINRDLPAHTPFREHFRDGTLLPPLSSIDRKFSNANDRKYLDSVIQNSLETLRYIKGSPSVQLTRIPPDLGFVRAQVEKEYQQQKKEKEQMLGVDNGEVEARRKKKEAARGTVSEMYVD